MGWQSSRDTPSARGLGIDWAGGGADARQADPYLLWASLTGFRTYRPPQRGDLRLAAFELRDEVKGPDFLQALERVNAERWSAGQSALLSLAPHHARRLAAAAASACRHFVGWMKVEDFAGSALAPLVRSCRVALVGAVEGVAPAAAAALIGPGVPLPDAAPPPRQRQRGRAPVVGIIDIGCAFAHPRLAQAGAGPWRTRVSHLWDMGRDADAAGPSPWQPNRDFGYGRETDAARLNALIAAATAAHRHPGAPGHAGVERSCYEAAGLPELLSPRKRWSHGTMVMDFAVGADPQQPPADAASVAEIVFVQLPPEAVEDLSCGWLTPHVIDALHYIVHKADGRRAVVNLSFGAYAGSHDGESLLERALDAIAAEFDVVLVLSAGNARGLGLHATATLEPNATKALQWVLPRDDSTQSFLELWYERAGAAAAPAAPAVTLQHRDLPPMPPLAGAGAAWFGFDDVPQRPVAAVLHAPGTAAGGPDGLILVSLGPTDREVTLPHWEPVRAPSGYWTLTLHNRGSGPLKVHAWVERDDPDLAARSEFAQSRLIGVAGGFEVDDAGTLTGQACGTRTIVVGSRVQNDGIALAPDSGVGPARRGARIGPDLVAAGVRRGAVGLVGIETIANLSGSEPVRLSGTSLSAPRVARLAFEALATKRVTGGPAQLLARWFAASAKGGAPGTMPPPDQQLGLGWIDDDGKPVPLQPVPGRTRGRASGRAAAPGAAAARPPAVATARRRSWRR